MIPRYTHKEMGAVWSETRRYGAWLEVELAATDALAAAGIVPDADARTLRERAGFDVARIEEIERTTQHDVIAFTTAVAERVGPAARWLHYGLTSSDVIDTALALQMRDACDLVLADVDAAMRQVHPRRRHGLGQDSMQFAAMEDHVRRTELGLDRRSEWRARQRAAILPPALVKRRRAERHFGQLRTKPEADQQP